MYQNPAHSYSWMPFACKDPRSYVDMTSPPTSLGSTAVDMSRSNSNCSSCTDPDVRPEKMQFVNSKCVVFTYYKGDVSSSVDEHFSRALSQPSSFTKECPTGNSDQLKVVDNRRTGRSNSVDFSSNSYNTVFPTPVSPLSRTCHFNSPVFPGPIAGSSLPDTWLSMNLSSRTGAYSPYSGTSYFPYTAPPMYGYKQFW